MLVVLAVVTGLGAYAVADVREQVPGILTTAPRPEPYPDLPTAPGASAEPSGPAPLPGLTGGAAPNPGAVAARLGPLLADPALGPSVGGSVVDAETGTVLLDSAASTAREPASVAKVLTSAAALDVLGPDTTLPTRVVGQPGSDQIHLVAGGDVLLAAGESDPEAVNGRAGLTTLARATAEKLRAEGRGSVTVILDDSILGGLGWGEAMGPGWSGADVRSGFVAPVTGLAVNAGRLGTENYAPRVADPGLDAAVQFATALRAAGIAVDGAVVRGSATAGAPELAEVRSAPISALVGYTLRASDNNAAEALARLVAIKAGGQPTFAGGGAQVLAAVAALGVDTAGCHLADGSGLSDGSKLTPIVLARTLAVADSDAHPQLRALLQGLPVAGLTGTLVERFGKGSGAEPAVGIVRAKTGSLTHVSALAGQTTTADGRLVTFAFLADQVPATEAARAALDRLAAAVAACGCG